MIIFISITGWVVIYLISTRALKRADITKSKDTCITCLEETISFVEYLNDEDKRKKLNALDVETKLATLATRLELKLMSLNGISKITLLCPIDLSLFIRNRDCEKILNEKSQRLETVERCLDSIEQLEHNYRQCFFEDNFFQRLLKNRHPELKGAIFGLVIVILLIVLIKTVT